MSSTDDDLAICLIMKNRDKKKKKRIWVHPYNKDVGVFGSYAIISQSQELRNDPVKFQSYYRMNLETFDLLVSLLCPAISKSDTKYRKAIRPEERILITLRFLATGTSFRALSYQFKRGETTVGNIVKEVCEAMWTILQPEYMPVPHKDKWMEISDRYYELWNMPHCLGSIDGKHFRIKCPNNSGSAFYNYKSFFSIVLLAVTDADGLFITIDVGDYGRNSDGGVLRNSNFGRKLLDNQLDLPVAKCLPKDSSGLEFPYFFVGDEAFALSKNLMKPYSRKSLTNEKRIYNYRLSRARRSVECAFGMLVSKFRLFLTRMCMKPSTCDSCIKAACILHNFIRIREGKFSQPSFMEDNDKSNCSSLNPLQPCRRRPPSNAKNLRDMLCDYFQQPYAALPWQNNYTVL